MGQRFGIRSSMQRLLALVTVAIGLLAVPRVASAVELAQPRVVDSLHAHTNGRVAIYFNNLAPLCVDTSDNALWLDAALPNSKLMVDLIYSAYLARRRIGLAYSCGADGKPWISVVRVFL